MRGGNGGGGKNFQRVVIPRKKKQFSLAYRKTKDNNENQLQMSNQQINSYGKLFFELQRFNGQKFFF